MAIVVLTPEQLAICVRQDRERPWCPSPQKIMAGMRILEDLSTPDELRRQTANEMKNEAHKLWRFADVRK